MLQVNPDAGHHRRADSPMTVDKPELIRGRRALVDRGRAHAHPRRDALRRRRDRGEARTAPARSSTRGRGWSARSSTNSANIRSIGALLPAMGYSKEQIREMERTINATECDVVVIATPIDLRRS